MNTDHPAGALAEQIAAPTQGTSPSSLVDRAPDPLDETAGAQKPAGPTLYIENFPWMAASLGDENPQPIFRDPNFDMVVKADASLSPTLAATLGHSCGRRVLPYRMQDRYGRDRELKNFRSVVLENENLKATFLPELGGRLISLFHKPSGRELLFKNPVFQPANLALRDAWFAGGIEWNIGQFGHAFHTCAPVFAAAIPGLDGEQGLRLYDFERCKGLLWQIDFYLPAGAEFLYAFTRVVNTSKVETPMYWWTNTAVRESSDLRVLAPAEESVYVDYGGKGGGLTYGQGHLPGLPTVGGKDGTYSKNLNFTNEFFFQCQGAEMPWQAALDGRGTGFAEASTHPLIVRKVFCWGMHQGGSSWKEFLSLPNQDYLEIQAGLAPTQQHTIPMPAGDDWHWTQAFGYLEADPNKIHGPEWMVAWKAADQAMQQKLTPAALGRIEARCAANADSLATTMLNNGSGWGALESKRRETYGEAAFPPAFAFSDTTLEVDQERWLSLLENGKFPDQDPAFVPGQWMIQSDWQELLEKSLDTLGNRHWLALLHLGVMKIEQGDDGGAIKDWEESIRLRPSAWAWRNLGAAAVRRGAPADAMPLYETAWRLASAAGTPDISFALEYLSALQMAGENQKGWAFFQSLPPHLQKAGTLRLLAAKIALVRDDLPFVEAALHGDYDSIREGAADLTDLWFGLQAKRISTRDGRPYDEDLLRQVKATCVPPARIDFRIVE